MAIVSMPNAKPQSSNGNGKLAIGRYSRSPEGRVASAALAKERKPEERRIDTIAEWMDADYQVRLAKLTLRANIQSVQVSIAAVNADGQADAIAERLQTLWEKSLASMIEAISHGRVAYEKVWTYDGTSYIRKLDPLPFKATEMILDDDGSFAGIKLKAAGKELTIPVEQSWWLALDPTALEPHGRSRYLGAPYKTWEQRREALRLRKVFIERFVLGWAKAHVEPTKVDPERPGEVIDNFKRIGDAYDAARSGGIIMFDNARDEEGRFLEDIEEMPQVETIQPLDDAIDGMDAEQLRAFGIPEKTVIEGDAVGSFALVTQQMLILYSVVEDILGQFVNSFQAYIIAPTAEANGLPADAITATFPRLTEKPDSIVAEIVKGMFATGVVPPTLSLIDIGQVLRSSGIPLTEDFEVKLADVMGEAKKLREQQAMQPTGFGGPAPRPAAPPQRQFALANDPAVSRLPTQEQFTLAAQRRASQLLRRLEAELILQRSKVEAQRDYTEAARIMRSIRKLEADSISAGRVLGMVTPWRPSLRDTPATAKADAKPITLALEFWEGFDEFNWPWVDEAVAFLDSKQIMPASEFARIADEDRVAVFSAPGIDDARVLNELRDEISRSAESGESMDDFRRRVGDRIGFAEHESNTIFRTNIKQSYIAGQEAALDNPAVAEEFPYEMYAATMDSRTRPSHRALDGMIARRGSDLHAVMMRAVTDWNCRCTLIPLTAEQADAQGGVNGDSEIPPEAAADYS